LFIYLENPLSIQYITNIALLVFLIVALLGCLLTGNPIGYIASVLGAVGLSIYVNICSACPSDCSFICPT